MDPWVDWSDEQLIAACLSGNAGAFAGLVRRHQRKVFNVLYRFSGSYEASQDLAQETFIAAYQKLYMFSGKSKFSSWLCQIALNKARDSLRHQGGQPVCEDLEDHAQQLSIPEGELPAQHLESAQLHQQVQEVLNTLPLHYREVLVLKHLEGYSYDEMSHLLDTPVGNVKIRTFRARQMFREIYEARCGHD